MFFKLYFCAQIFTHQQKHQVMKKTIIALLTLLFPVMAQAQADIIKKHNGETVTGKVLKVDEYTVIFSYENEDAQNTLSKYAIEKVTYGKSGRVEEITEKINVRSEDDWEKVVIFEEKSYIVGLKKVEEIKGKTGLINYHTGNTGDRKAEKKLKMQAAELKCPFIFMTADKSTVGSSSNSMGGSQVIKKGIAYKY
jgi:sRNA-binding regulator protein Hfq